MISFVQINVGGGRAAQNLALQIAAEQGADFLILSEYYKYSFAHLDWYCDRSGRVAIAPLTNAPMDDVGGATEDGFVWVTVEGTRIYSCYWSPNSTLHEYEDFICRLEASIRSAHARVIVVGDFNAKHPCWVCLLATGGRTACWKWRKRST